MKISGFTIAKDAIKYDYPVKECILTLLNICDEVIAVVGESNDETIEELRKIKDPKLKIIPTVWDDSLGFRIFSQQTNIAIEECTGDWGIYLQCDELIHEQDYNNLKLYIAEANNNNAIEGLLFNYKHFYSSYFLCNESRKFYRNEVRAIRLGIGIYSHNDAKGFRRNNRKLIVKSIPISIYHYGWARNPEKMQIKYNDFQRFWHSEEKIKKLKIKNIYNIENNYNLIPFAGSHPSLMNERIKNSEWSELNFWKFLNHKKKVGLKSLFFLFLSYLERKTWWIGYNKPYSKKIS